MAKEAFAGGRRPKATDDKTIDVMGPPPSTALPDMKGLGGVFDANRSINLRDLIRADGTTPWNTRDTGHSAQFVHSFTDVAGYWQKLIGDIK